MLALIFCCKTSIIIHRPYELDCIFETVKSSTEHATYECHVFNVNILITDCKCKNGTIILDKHSLTKTNHMPQLQIAGRHEFGRSHGDVKSIKITESNITEIPNGIGKVLENLEKLSVYISDLQVIDQKNFADMENLRKLELYENDLEEIEPKTFFHLGNLEEVSLSYNRIKFFHKLTFSRLINLKIILANGNLIEFLDKDLFQHNPLLEIISLSSNQITKINIDFRSFFKEIQIINFSENICISDSFYADDSEALIKSIAKFQLKVNSLCP